MGEVLNNKRYMLTEGEPLGLGVSIGLIILFVFVAIALAWELGDLTVPDVDYFDEYDEVNGAITRFDEFAKSFKTGVFNNTFYVVFIRLKKPVKIEGEVYNAVQYSLGFTVHDIDRSITNKQKDKNGKTLRERLIATMDYAETAIPQVFKSVVGGVNPDKTPAFKKYQAEIKKLCGRTPFAKFANI